MTVTIIQKLPLQGVVQAKPKGLVTVSTRTVPVLTPGPAGPPGQDGAQGPAGPPGPAGEDGSLGSAGPRGQDGAEGPPGADGARGPQGEPGGQGIPGAEGLAGPRGPSGADGAPGAVGPAGNDGLPGTKGDRGDRGEQGPAGPTGSEGAQGPKGDTGPVNDDAIPKSTKGQPFGVADLDGSGGLAQRMKIAAGSTPGVIRDTQGEGNGKSSLYAASIATDGASTILIKTGVWQGQLDYAFRVFGTTAAGVVNLSVYRVVVGGAPTYGFMNNGNVPVTVTFGSFGDGYSGWAIQGNFGRAQFVVTDVAVVGNGTGDPQVRDWSMLAANDSNQLNSQVAVARQNLG